MSANRSPYELLDACKESTVGAGPNLTIVGRPYATRATVIGAC
jgi:hypothetical protein